MNIYQIPDRDRVRRRALAEGLVTTEEQEARLRVNRFLAGALEFGPSFLTSITNPMWVAELRELSAAAETMADALERTQHILTSRDEENR